MRLVALLLFTSLLCGCPVEAPEASEAPGGGGAGGRDGSTDDCVDLTIGAACQADRRPSECGTESVCTITQQSCPGQVQCCQLGFSCEPRVGPVPGGVRCESDGDCLSGVCLGVRDGLSICLQGCTLDPSDSCPEGTHCAILSLSEGASVRACLGGTAGDPRLEETVCRWDDDCLEGRICRFQLTQRRTLTDQQLAGTCVVPDFVSDGAGRPCAVEAPYDLTEAELRGAALCPERGLCRSDCASMQADTCDCSTAGCQTMRCARPCRGDDDCRQPEICRPLDPNGTDADDPLVRTRVCELPTGATWDWGCRDETDCCRDGSQRGGSACCSTVTAEAQLCHDETTRQEITHCTPEPAAPGRWTARCQPPAAGRSGPGAPCASDADCASESCVEAPEGKRCGSLCDPMLDRCGQILPGSACCGRERAAPDGGVWCVATCRFDCAAAPGCAP